MSSANAAAASEIGTARVVTTSNGGHSVDTLADMCMDKIMHVSETAPEPIRLQAEAFKATVRGIIVGCLTQAKISERTTIAAKLRECGLEDAANTIGAL